MPSLHRIRSRPRDAPKGSGERIPLRQRAEIYSLRTHAGWSYT